MNISDDLLKDSKRGMAFDDLVAKYLLSIDKEDTLSVLNDRHYEAIWTFRDGSQVKLKGYQFDKLE